MSYSQRNFEILVTDKVPLRMLYQWPISLYTSHGVGSLINMNSKVFFPCHFRPSETIKHDPWRMLSLVNSRLGQSKVRACALSTVPNVESGPSGSSRSRGW